MTRKKQNKVIDIEVINPLLIRRNSISRYSSSEVSIRCPSRLSVHRISGGSYLWDCVQSGSIQITVPYSVCSLIEHTLKPEEGMIVTLDHLLAVTAERFPATTHAFDTSSFIDGRHFFHHIKGPAHVVLFGAGEVTCEDVIEPMQIRRGSIIAYSDTLSYGVGLSNSSVWHAISQSHVLEDRVEGVGQVFRQTSSLSMTKIAAAESKSGNTLVDYVNAFLGIR